MLKSIVKWKIAFRDSDDDDSLAHKFLMGRIGTKIKFRQFRWNYFIDKNCCDWKRNFFQRQQLESHKLVKKHFSIRLEPRIKTTARRRSMPRLVETAVQNETEEINLNILNRNIR